MDSSGSLYLQLIDLFETQLMNELNSHYYFSGLIKGL